MDCPPFVPCVCVRALCVFYTSIPLNVRDDENVVYVYVYVCNSLHTAFHVEEIKQEKILSTIFL